MSGQNGLVKRRGLGGVLLTVALVAAACASGSDVGTDTDAPGIDTAGQCTLPDDAPSVVRVWNDEALDAIRADFPAPTVHARNLYHLSATLWDVWVAYQPADSTATALFVDEQRGADLDPQLDGDPFVDAMSFAAHRILTHRYNLSLGRIATIEALDERLTSMCGPGALDDQAPGTAAAFGVSVADRIIDATIDDGSLERKNYEDLDYDPVNEPLRVAESGTTLADPDRWQPLLLKESLSQNGLPLPGGEQTFIGSNWGDVTPFALGAPAEAGLPVDPGPPPLLADPTTADEYRNSALDVVRASAVLQAGEATADIGPNERGNNTLGSDDGIGYRENPVTGEPYARNVVDVADWARVIAEYWADGPTSETPPGHWNSLANSVSDQLFAESDRTELVGADGATMVERLEWDVKVGLGVNGALHDAAIAAWGAKAHYDYVRPISMIRYLGERDELPITDGLVEEITADSSAVGERHEALADHVGEIAIRAWAGSPSVPEVYTSGVEWILAVDWVPYQRSTFVTPAFAAYVSGHSVFSRAAAEVLAGLTGSEYFPGGIDTHIVEPGDLIHEKGPTAVVELQWATYFDASDEAGRSRIYGGIHITADDHAGRVIGSEVGTTALETARSLF